MSLALTFDNLKTEVSATLGIPFSDASVDRAVNRGLRQFYVPSLCRASGCLTDGRFLKSESTLTTHAATTTATVTIPSDDTDRVNFTSGSLLTTDTLSVSHLSLVNSGTTTKHLVGNVADSTTLDLAEAAGFTGTGISCTVHYNGTYALPATFAGIEERSLTTVSSGQTLNEAT